MPSRIHQELKQMFHPYFFVLKEGSSIGTDLLDYSLMMMHTHCREILKSPRPASQEIAVMQHAADTASRPLRDQEGEVSNSKIPSRPKREFPT